jgi:hypothetical protein
LSDRRRCRVSWGRLATQRSTMGWLRVATVVVLVVAAAAEYGAVSGAEAHARRRGLRAARALQEERLIGWLGETYHGEHAETKSKEIHRLADEEKARGGWVEQLSWRPRAYVPSHRVKNQSCFCLVSAKRSPNPS